MRAGRARRRPDRHAQGDGRGDRGASRAAARGAAFTGPALVRTGDPAFGERRRFAAPTEVATPGGEHRGGRLVHDPRFPRRLRRRTLCSTGQRAVEECDVGDVRIREEIAGLPAYKAGKPAATFEGTAYKLSSNENPYPPLPG